MRHLIVSKTCQFSSQNVVRIVSYAVFFKGNHKAAYLMAEMLLDSKHIALGGVQEKMRLINVINNKGETALHVAAINHNKKLVETLILGGADVNIK